MTHLAKIRYIDEQNRSHYIEIESDVADRRHIEEVVRCSYPAKQIYFQGVYQKWDSETVDKVAQAGWWHPAFHV